MISICIPVYNTDVRELAEALHGQAERLDGDTEILLLDDRSDDTVRETNRAIRNLPRVRYKELPANTGRSRIRNRLASLAEQDFLLFLDCDMQITNPDFLRHYADLIPSQEVVCGGHTYPPEPPAPEFILHWKAGCRRESVPASVRNRRPHHAFMTSNFLIRKEIFSRLTFSEYLNGYGHEDTLFGYQLKLLNIPVFHTDNPARHKGLEPADVFLEKTRQAIRNLLHIEQMIRHDDGFTHMIRVLRTRKTLRRLHLGGVYRHMFSCFRKGLENHLLGERPGLRMLDLYKLGVLLTDERGMEAPAGTERSEPDQAVKGNGKRSRT